MSREAYLTIDDSPSGRTIDLADALKARNVPAILFCRGDLLDQNPGPVIHAIKQGLVIGNHGYHHKRASLLGYDAVCDGIKRTDELINASYQKAGIKRPGKYYRFAYMDRGMGAWFVEPSSVKPEDKATIESIISEGLGNDPAALPTDAGIETKRRLQAFLRDLGYAPVPFAGVTHGFYQNSEMKTAIDAMFTFSTSDWALNDRYKGKHKYQALDDLKRAIDNDPHLGRDDTAHIILAHDHDAIHDVTLGVVDYMLDKGFIFKEV